MHASIKERVDSYEGSFVVVDGLSRKRVETSISTLLGRGGRKCMSLQICMTLERPQTEKGRNGSYE